MLKMFSQMGRPKELLDAWNQCVEETTPDEISYRWVIEGLARGYWVRSAVDAVKQMLDQGLMPSKRHLQLLRQRCREEDLRKQRWRLETMLREAQPDHDSTLKLKENAGVLMRQKLAGDGIRPFLLPFPLAHLKNEKKKNRD